MWEDARKQVAEIFFKDVISIYENQVVVDEIGEEHNEKRILGTFPCNIENGASSVKEGMSGISTPQTLRISLAKDTPLQYEKTYVIEVEQARIHFDPQEEWKVEGWTEGQISTVITASRRVAL